MNNPSVVEATHLRIAELVQNLPSRSDTDADTVLAELAEHAAVEIPGAQYSARRDEQFKKALASRDVIGQAKGMIMERYGVDAVQAFELLRKLSQDSNVPLIKVATEFVADTQSARD
ncbi:MAG TPA: ANTAR domain-containing protein [Mycobacterium sp.]